MNSNGTSGDSSTDSSDSRNNYIISIIALASSLVALLATLVQPLIAQILQQIYSSNVNFSPRVMGQWYYTQKTAFRWTSLRWEPEFETPVLFLCPPYAEKGPIEGLVYPIDGTSRSLLHTRSSFRRLEEIAYAEPWRPSRRDSSGRPSSPPKEVKVIRTPDNERATWVTLLSELQGMEIESRNWQTNVLSGYSSPIDHSLVGRSLVVAVQAMRRRWSSLPSTVKKPYATTTICHVLEIAAIMGIYWREFDRFNNRYLALGNGYFLTGSHVPELGLTFEFHISGPTTFKENRVIPVHEVKELCLGILTTLFRMDSDPRMLDLVEDSQSFHWLQLGSQNEIAETLVSLRCNTYTANCLRNNDKKHGHLFPVVFELVGMLGKTLHIRNTCFRMLPNPTPYHWDTRFFTLREMLRELRNKIANDDLTRQTARVHQLIVKADNIRRQLQRMGRIVEEYDLELLEKLHDALDDCDSYLRDDVRRDLLLLVLREHFQLILQLINNEGQDETGTGTTDGTHHRGHFDKLHVTRPEKRAAKFMEIYFTVVLPAVLRGAVEAHRIHVRELSRADSARSAPPAAASAGVTTADNGNGDSASVEVTGEATTGQAESFLQTQASDIWCTLVFRMLCYLLLHDFHKNDAQIQILKSDLVGNRLPAYIM